jgi:hypothetical protein
MQMALPEENDGSRNGLVAGFAVIWSAGILTFLLSLRLTGSVTLWDLGVPVWLIDVAR